VKVGLLRKLIVVYNQIVLSIAQENDNTVDKTNIARWKPEELHKLCDIFLLFSQGDVVVKEHMCELVVLEGKHDTVCRKNNVSLRNSS